MTALINASKNGHIEIVSLLIKKGANLETACARFGINALISAIENNHEDIVYLLIDNGANVHVQTK